jgi:hypothetical protein
MVISFIKDYHNIFYPNSVSTIIVNQNRIITIHLKTNIIINLYKFLQLNIDTIYHLY